MLRYQTHKPARDAADSLLAHLAADNRVYAELDPLGAATGRFSCREPNLQGLAAPVLQAIEAVPGCVLLEADYSQMELRILAHFSQDAGLLHAFHHNIDLHRRTAARVLGIAEADVTDQQRQLGKTLNFGIVFGQTAYGLAEELAVPMQRAEAMLAAHAAAYPGVTAWIANVHRHVANTGEVRTLYGRRRYLPNIYSTLPGAAAEAQRQAVNTIIQGSAADLLKLALGRLHAMLPTEVKMLLPVHDSVLLEVPINLVEATCQIVTNAMQAAPAGFTVPLKVDIHTGRTWADCK
jgi:DNA polymerase-1